MDLNRITVFARVVEEGSFTRAARALGLPKSSVSRSVALLEEDLGARLLQRSSRKVSATDAGAAYYARVAGALASIGEANACAAEQRAAPQGMVRITAPFDARSDVFIPLLARFIREHPTITVDLELSGRIVDLAAEGFDMALRGGPVRDQSLISRKIAEIRFGLFASRAYLKRRGAPATVKDLASHDCVIFRGTRGRSTWTLTSAERTETVDVTGGLSVDDLGAVRAAVFADAGIGLFAPYMCAKEIASGKVIRVLPEWVGPASLLSLVYPSARFVPQRVVLVRDYLLEELRRVPWSCTEAPRSVASKKRL
jgi:DNA-binding transcriptional LysR family regulator